MDEITLICNAEEEKLKEKQRKTVQNIINKAKENK